MISVYVDSGANIPAVYVEKYGINVIPFINLVDGREIPGFEPGLTEEQERQKGKEYYDNIRNGAKVSTSLINTGTFEDIFEKELAAGNDVVYIAISSGISGTFNAASTACEELRERYPDREICAVDSMNASLASGIPAIYATELAAKGMGAQEIARLLTDAAPYMNGVFTVGDLKYLANTGRISGVAAFAGNVLNIKPILKGNAQGFIVQVKKMRGRKKAVDELSKLILDNIIEPEKQILGIAHADAYEESLEVMEKVREKVQLRDFINTSYDFCTGSHVGPDTIAVFFMGYDRELAGEREGYKRPELFEFI